jgi:hypothetical protein
MAELIEKTSREYRFDALGQFLDGVMMFVPGMDIVGCLFCDPKEVEKSKPRFNHGFAAICTRQVADELKDRFGNGLKINMPSLDYNIVIFGACSAHSDNLLGFVRRIYQLDGDWKAVSVSER